ncbi:DUF4231 domain-containing protein [Oceanospirillum maris]|uniref:DUF4231 domain-containing protein n=1 Tax=Oceanospirillum maris TaxID=64977 RepID=UPI000400C16E|nr:DUF4231 domain-containing protein [Oceanospirillum maris]
MSEETSQLDFLQNEISNSIDKLKEKVKSSKRKTSFVNALSITLGAIITLTLGLDVSDENIQFQKNLALLFGALLTITSSWNALFDYKKLWVRQKSTLLALYQIQNELGYRKSKNGESQFDDIFEKYQDIWEKDGSEWRNIFQSVKIANNDVSK